MPQAVIFDFDGVIADSEALHFHTFNEVLSPYGIEFTAREYYKNYLGLSDFDLFGLFARQGKLPDDGQTVVNLIKQKNQLFEELAKTQGSIIDGVYDILAMLKQNNIPIAICSGALLAEIELTLHDAKLRNYFSVIVSAEQVSKGKPDPEGFLLALQKLNEIFTPTITAEKCIVIEDSHWGLEAALAAKMHTIAVTNSYEASQLTIAEKTVTNLKDLTLTDLQSLC